ncbi:hypothetical protein PG997_010021 [Apiospora hydei]|uniref:2EXR domain-containing protein n=1 Tax=Apiospora hydei TaxID=1337664 RepID=A0ABR1VVU9_9PEZI
MCDTSTDLAIPAFAGFPKLPCELRLIIWNLALEGENSNRLVFIHRPTMRPVPMRSLVSPLLSVNTESREAARKYYTLRLEVVRLPAMESQDSFVDYPPSRPYQPGAIRLCDTYRTLPQSACTYSECTWLLKKGLEIRTGSSSSCRGTTHTFTTTGGPAHTPSTPRA